METKLEKYSTLKDIYKAIVQVGEKNEFSYNNKTYGY
jgi:hypothetical protein